MKDLTLKDSEAQIRALNKALKALDVYLTSCAEKGKKIPTDTQLADPAAGYRIESIHFTASTVLRQPAAVRMEVYMLDRSKSRDDCTRMGDLAVFSYNTHTKDITQGK